MERSSINRTDDVPRIPGYELLELVGAGGMGVVYRARQIQPPRMVAIKYLLRLPSDQTAILSRRYERESQMMASLNHPNVVAMYDCGKLLGQFYLIMEYVGGTTLRALMKPETSWPLRETMPVLDTVAQALAYIHSQDVLHLDLKPENILCDAQGGALKITDFGLALLQKINDHSMIESVLAQGTMDYCAPEQRFGLPVDARSDLFSLAKIAYELLTGCLPGRIYTPCAPAHPQIPEAVDDVLRRALAREPEERYPSVEAFRHELALACRSAAP